MITGVSRLSLITEYELATASVLFAHETVAVIRVCTLATIERDLHQKMAPLFTSL